MKFFPLFVLMFFINISSLFAEHEIIFDGDWRYDISETSVHLWGGKIYNDNNEATSGSLLVEMYLTTERFDGSTSISGIIPFRKHYQPLEADSSYDNVDVDQSLEGQTITPGTYWVTITLAECVGGDYQIVDFITFDKLKTIYAPYSAGTTMAPTKPKTYTAPNFMLDWGVALNGTFQDTVVVDGGLIANNTSTTSDSLKIVAYALPTKYNGATLNGYELGSRFIVPLQPGYKTRPIHFLRLVKQTPKPGNYYLVIVLYEKVNGTYKKVDAISLPKKQHFD